MNTGIEPHKQAYYEVASDIRALHDEIRGFADKIEELEGDIVIIATIIWFCKASDIHVARCVESYRGPFRVETRRVFVQFTPYE